MITLKKRSGRTSPDAGSGIWPIKLILIQSADERSTFLIWDVPGVPPKGKWAPVLWRSFGEGDDPVPSIPKLVEQRADELRERYLAWIFDLGESRIKGKRLVDHLELRPGFSYWWMTLIAEKSNAYKSFRISDAVKLLVFEEMVMASPISAIILESGDKFLAQTFRLWARNAGVAYEWRPVYEARESVSLIRRLYRSLPKPVQAAFSMAHAIRLSRPLKKRNERLKVAKDGAITFADYLIHLDKRAFSTGRFVSDYWTDLIDALDCSGLKVNWLHRYIPHEAISSPEQARDLIARFNHAGAERQFHFCLDAEMSIPVVFAALINYSRLVRMWLKLSKIKRRFRPDKSKLDFWPLFRQDWLNSMLGPDAASNCLVLSLLERTLVRLPRQSRGVYLRENQGWEMALIYAWRAAGHGQLIGVPHSTIRYWDLRYFYDSRSYLRSNKNDLPLPDIVALNGAAALNAYHEIGNLNEKIVEVEALRYLYLYDLKGKIIVPNQPKTRPLRVLVLTDYTASITSQQMRWLNDSALLLSQDTHFILRSHPACRVDPKEYPSLKLRTPNATLKELLVDCDVAYTSNITSAAVDAYCAGIPVVSMLDGNTFNMSPLRGLAGVLYVTNSAELAGALQKAHSIERIEIESYFCLDEKLPRWRKLLNLNPFQEDQ